jgi:undecaprenyl-diphosphatase
MSIAEAIVLAIVEGLTEFLPISSTGHMIIVASWMGIGSDPFTKTFIVTIQLGAILSVIILYWRRFFQSVSFYVKLFIAFLPAAVVGLILNKYIDRMLERVDVVGYMLILGGIVFLFVDKFFKKSELEGSTEIPNPSAFKIGCFQAISVLAPGISRSAATIIGGLTQHLTRKTAAEFSFFLAVPTMLAATGYKLLKSYQEAGIFESNRLGLLLLGNVIAFVVAIFAIKSFIQFLTRHGFMIFGIYRIVVGLIILSLYYLGTGISII